MFLFVLGLSHHKLLRRMYFRSNDRSVYAPQADAMELELRYTLESFEGQLNAMAREKVAMQKQVKELTGQRTTLRKQVGR